MSRVVIARIHIVAGCGGTKQKQQSHIETDKIVLHDYINATIGFAELGSRVDKSPNSPMRMLGPKGNPRTDNLVKILSCLQKHEGLDLQVRPG